VPIATFKIMWLLFNGIFGLTIRCRLLTMN